MGGILQGSLDVLESGWHFAGKILDKIGPFIVKIFEGAIWLAKFLFVQLGKLMLAGLDLLMAAPGLIASGIVAAAKFGWKGMKMAWGGLKMVGSLFKKIPDMLAATFKGIGRLFEGAFNLAGSMFSMLGTVGGMAVDLAKIGLGKLGTGIMFLISGMGKLFKHMGVGLGVFFKMLGAGLLLGGKLFLKKLSSITGVNFTAGFGVAIGGIFSKLGALGLAGLKKMWAGIKAGGLMLGSVFKAIGNLKVTDIRWILTGIVLVAYALWMCFGAGMCQRHYQKPGWGEPGTHSISGVIWPNFGNKFKGGKGHPRYSQKLSRNESGAWMMLKVPVTSDNEVNGDETRGDGLGLEGTPRSQPRNGGRRGSGGSGMDSLGGPLPVEAKIYKAPPKVDWERPVGAIQVTEVDRSPSIKSIDFSGSDLVVNMPEPGQRSGQGLGGVGGRGGGGFGGGGSAGPSQRDPPKHPNIVLDSPATSVRVQMYDVQTGDSQWDSVYFLEKPGVIDSSAREVGTGSSSGSGGFFANLNPFGGGPKDGESQHVSSETPPNGYKSFERLNVHPGDDSTHEFEVLVTKYPSNSGMMHGNDAAEEDNHIGSAHFKVAKVQDPMPPSEAHMRLEQQMASGSSAEVPEAKASLMGEPSVVLAALSPDAGRLPTPSSASLCTWRSQRHREFWSAPRPTPRSGAVPASKAGHPRSVGRQAHFF